MGPTSNPCAHDGQIRFTHDPLNVSNDIVNPVLLAASQELTPSFRLLPRRASHTFRLGDMNLQLPFVLLGLLIKLPEDSLL